MKNIEVTNFKGNKYEGSWNEKTYSSNIADHPDLYRIYVNDQAIHITEKEYNLSLIHISEPTRPY